MYPKMTNNQLHYWVYIPIYLRSWVETEGSTKHKSFFGMWSDVKHHIRCVKCQTLKSNNLKSAGKLQKITTTCLNYVLRVDIMSPVSHNTERAPACFFLIYYCRWVNIFSPIHYAISQNAASILRKRSESVAVQKNSCDYTVLLSLCWNGRSESINEGEVYMNTVLMRRFTERSQKYRLPCEVGIVSSSWLGGSGNAVWCSSVISNWSATLSRPSALLSCPKGKWSPPKTALFSHLPFC